MTLLGEIETEALKGVLLLLLTSIQAQSVGQVANRRILAGDERTISFVWHRVIGHKSRRLLDSDCAESDPIMVSS